MAILKGGNDEYKVRIKRYPEKTYFDEYIKTGEREKTAATTCKRYIVGEDGVKYTIEVTLKKGFMFGEFHCVQAQLNVPGKIDSVCRKIILRPADYKDGIKEKITTELESADVTVRGLKLLGARFAFRSLALDEKLVNETDLMGIDPESLGFFEIALFKIRWENRRLTDEEYKTKVAAANDASKVPPPLNSSLVVGHRKEQHLWDAQKVDEDSFKKDGIVYAIGFVGGKPQFPLPEPARQPFVSPVERGWPNSVSKKPAYVSRIVDVPVTGTSFHCHFYYRTSEFLEQTGIVKYPPPLYLYAWKDLDKSERQTVLKELQAINKEHVINAIEAKTGKIHVMFGKGRGKDEAKEWRAWSRMSEWEKEDAFESLRKSKKAHERGEAIRQYESRSGEIISLVDEDEEQSEDDEQSKTEKKDPFRTKTFPDLEYTAARSEDGFTVKKESKIKNEPVEIRKRPKDDVMINSSNGATPARNNKNFRAHEDKNITSTNDKSPGVEEHKKIAPTRNNEIDDDELERKMANARALDEEIEREERLAKLKRERRALQDEIEDAKRKKQKHGEE
ncbi:hypothetical protein F5882DRAFT_482007 [Hyaloscypha sp. PMI_1271]|nr:hypothetical protein F5882DRAFT_482007 [Hyaloscypha sp. PMI_1271]